MIAGPTGSGKTGLAAALARALPGEIVSADSRQVYRGFDAATAKAHPEGVAQYLIDVAAPEEPFDVGRFRDMSLPIIADIRSRGLHPIVAGGTGLYIKALLEGLSELPQRNERIRTRLLSELERLGESELHQRLALSDPEAARRIPSGNAQRLLRALEVLELTGRPISSFWGARRGAAPGPWLALRIDWPPETLATRLGQRCRRMWPALLAETRALRRRCSGREPAFESLGYREALAVVEGALAEAEAYPRFLKATLAYAKRQRTWFKNQLKAETINGGPVDEMLRQALRALSRAQTP